MSAHVSPGHFMDTSESEIFHLHLDEALFVLALDETTKKSAAIYFSSAGLDAETVLSACPELERRVGGTVVYKLVGHTALVNQMKQSFENAKKTVRSSAAREEAFEILYLAKEGVLKVAKDDPHLAAANQKKTRVLIVDDSSTIRQLLTKVLSEDPLIEIVGTADRPSVAETLIAEKKPDVITLDIHMPEMDGVTFLKKYIAKYPIPTVMITSISMEEGPMVLNALEAGAVDYIQKPSFEQLAVIGPLIAEKVKAAATAKVERTQRKFEKSKGRAGTAHMDESLLIAIGSSTGGTEALKHVFLDLPAEIPPVVVVQHIPPVFSKAFADRLDTLCPFKVKEAKDGDEVLPNQVLIAPGGTQMKLVRSGQKLKVKITDDAPVNRHKPSVDYLFDSVAELIGKNALGVILTGMGGDGAKGLLKMKQAGARTIAQNQESCVVFGMPAVAIKLGAAEKIVHLKEIANQLVKMTTEKIKKAV